MTMDHRHSLSTSPERRLAMTFRMQQALAILQMPQIELSQLIQEEIDKNPILEETGLGKKIVPSQEISSPDSLSENLLHQIRENFSDRQTQQIAKKLLEYLDEKGFLSSPPEEIAQHLDQPISRIEMILSTMQTFAPSGIFARNLQESLLNQLKAMGSENTPAFYLTRDYFHDLLHGRYSAIKKKAGEIDLAEAIQKLALLQLRPLDAFKREISVTVVPDLIIRRTEKGWTIGLNDEDLPKFQIHTKYESIQSDSKEEQETLRLWLSQGKWLLSCLNRRRKMLMQIGAYLIRYQANFLAQKGNLKPITCHDLALELQLHESTISRALSEKTIETPRGIIPLKSLLTPAPERREAKEILQELIAQENKMSPMTDDELSIELEKRGYKTARRTVSKYRNELKIRSAKSRKHL